MKQVIDRALVSRWLAGYEAAWRVPGTGGLAGLFTCDAAYLQSPCETARYRPRRDQADVGAGTRRPCEVFTLATGILAVDGPTAVVRAEVCYGDPPRQEYRDLWVIRFADDVDAPPIHVVSDACSPGSTRAGCPLRALSAARWPNAFRGGSRSGERRA